MYYNFSDSKSMTFSLQEAEVAPIIAGYWERAEFPHEVVPKIAKLGLGGGTIKGFGCAGQSVVEAGLTCIELARVDGSMSTFLMVHNSLCMLTIDLLGSEEQKQQLLPDLAALKTIGAWGLTEPSNGSDASALQTTATKVDGGYELNGCKRWIGNATFADWVVIWARNNETNQVNAFVVKKGTKGFKTSKIENKIALRCVQNADIEMTQCFVPDSARLPGVNSFKVSHDSSSTKEQRASVNGSIWLGICAFSAVLVLSEQCCLNNSGSCCTVIAVRCA